MKKLKSIKFLFIAAVLMPYLIEWIIQQSHFIDSLTYSESLSRLIISTAQKILLAVFILANYLDDKNILLFKQRVKIKFIHIIELTVMTWTSILFTVGLGLLLCCFIYYSKIILPEALKIVEIFSVEMPLYLIIYSGILTVILAPILEEIAYRSIIVKSFYKANSLKTATVYSALLFAFFHQHPISAFIFAILASLIYYKYKDIKYPIILHIINNGTACLFNLVPSQNSNTADLLEPSYRTLLNYGLILTFISVIIIAFYIMRTRKLIEKN